MIRVQLADEHVAVAHLTDTDNPWSQCPHPVTVQTWKSRTTRQCRRQRQHGGDCDPARADAQPKGVTSCGLGASTLLLPADDDLPLCPDCAGRTEPDLFDVETP